MLPQQINVAEQVMSGVRGKVGGGVACMRKAPPAVALVEEHHPVLARVEKPPEVRRAPRPRPAMHDDRRFTGRVAAGFPVDKVAVSDIQPPSFVGLDFGMEVGHLYPGRVSADRPKRSVRKRSCASKRLMSFWVTASATSTIS